MGDDNIASLWRDHFNDVYYSVDDDALKRFLLELILIVIRRILILFLCKRLVMLLLSKRRVKPLDQTVLQWKHLGLSMHKYLSI